MNTPKQASWAEIVALGICSEGMLRELLIEGRLPRLRDNLIDVVRLTEILKDEETKNEQK